MRVVLEKIGVLKRSEKCAEEERKEIGKKQFQERKGIVKLVLNIMETRELQKL